MSWQPPSFIPCPQNWRLSFCFAKFIEESCPLHVKPTLEGVHRGLRVCVITTDSRLQFLCFYALNSFSTDASRLWTQSCTTICAQRISLLNYMLFPCKCSRSYPVPVFHTRCLAVLTLCACAPPLDQVLRLWDFLLTFGVHLNILCVIAQLLLIRDDMIASSS
jgi:cell cycle arrest protein BUB2